MAVPAAMPITTPPALTLPMAVLLLLHVPPPEASVKVIVAPGQTTVVPLIAPADGNGVTTASIVAEMPAMV